MMNTYSGSVALVVYSLAPLVELSLDALPGNVEALDVTQVARASGTCHVVRQAAILRVQLVRRESFRHLRLLLGGLAPGSLVLGSHPVQEVGTIRPTPPLV